MWNMGRFALLPATFVVFGILMSLALRQLNQIPVASWRNLNLPPQTGVFLQALILVAIIYILWLVVGLLLQYASIWAARTGRTRLAQRLHRNSPRILRGLAVSALNTGLLVGSSVVPAFAAPGVQTSQLEEPAADTNSDAGPRTATLVPVPSWLPHNTAVTFSRSVGSPAPQVGSRQVVEEVVVLSGDTLWDIARKRLGPSASITDVAVYWPRIHAANREVVGPDPHFLRIGTVLLLPTPGN